MTPALLTPAEVASQLRLSVSGVYALCESGDLPHRRVGAKRGRIRIDRADLDCYLASRVSSPIALEAPQRRVSAVRGAEFLRSLGWKG
jgi:excisionase family DNA binding protein